jgi:hypothetical protein
MTKEQKFYQQFRKNLPKYADCVRVENVLQSGMPDVNVCLDGREIWVELKCYDHSKVLIRPQQYAWGMRRAETLGRVFIVALHPSNNIHVWMFPRIDVIPDGKYLMVGSRFCEQSYLDPALNIQLFGV